MSTEIADILFGTNSNTGGKGSPSEVDSYIQKYSTEFGVDPSLIKALVKQESGGKTDAVSHAGAMGTMQVMPGTGQEVADELGMEYTPDMLYNPETNIKLGTYYLAKQLKEFGDDERALAAYHAGPGAVRKANQMGMHLPNTDDGLMTTPDYVAAIMGNRGKGGYSKAALSKSFAGDDIMSTLLGIPSFEPKRDAIDIPDLPESADVPSDRRIEIDQPGLPADGPGVVDPLQPTPPKEVPAETTGVSSDYAKFEKESQTKPAQRTPESVQKSISDIMVKAAKENRPLTVEEYASAMDQIKGVPFSPVSAYSPEKLLGKEYEEIGAPQGPSFDLELPKTRKPVPETMGAAAVLGAIESVPFVKFKGKDIETLRDEFGGSYTAGQITGTMLQGFAGAGVAAKGLQGVSNPMLRNMVVRAIGAGLPAAGSNIEQVVQGKKAFNDAFWDTATAAGAGAVSVVPELAKGFNIGNVKIPWHVVQLIGQPMADFAYEASIDALRGKEVGTGEWWTEKAATVGMASVFALNDAMSGEQFLMDQKLMQKGVKSAFEKMGQWAKNRELKIETTPEGVQVLPGGQERIKQQIEAGKLNEKSKEKPTTKVPVVEKDVEFTTAKKGASGIEVKKAEPYKPTEKELKTLPDPEKKDYIKSEDKKPDEFTKQVTEFKSKTLESVEQANERNSLRDLGKAADEEAQAFFQKFDDEESGEVALLNNEKTEVVFGTDLQADLKKEILSTPDGERQWNLLVDTNKQDPRTKRVGKAESRSKEVEKILTRVADGFNEQKAFDQDESLRGVAPPKYDPNLDRYDNWQHDNVQDALRAGKESKKQLRKYKIDWNRRNRALQQEYDGALKDVDEIKTKIEEKEKLLDKKYAAPAEDLDVIKEAEEDTDFPFGTNAEDPNSTKPVDEFERKRGFLSKTGGTGEKQYKMDFSNEKSDPAAKVQTMLDKQRGKAKDKFGFNLGRYIDKFMSRFVERAAPLKKRLLKNDDGKKVVMHHDLIKGAPGESVRAFEVAEKEIWESIPHKYEHQFDDFIQMLRTVEVEKLHPDIKSPDGVKAAEAEAWLAKFKDQQPELYKNFEQTQKKYFKHISKIVLNERVEEGLMTRDLADKLLKEQTHYSLRQFIQHVDPDSPRFDKSGNLINVPDSGLKKLDGGSEEALLNNARLGLASVIARSKTGIFKNRANKSLLKFATDNPDNALGVTAEKPIGKTEDGKPKYAKVPADMTRINAMVDGQAKPMLMPTEMAKYWVTADPAISQNMSRFLNIASGSALLKPMATGINPGFVFSNIPRDIIHSWFTTKEYSKILPVAWAQQARDVARVASDVIKRKGRVTDYIKEGGSMEFLTQQGQLQKRPWEPQTATGESIQQMGKFLGWAGETSELWLRIALRERAMRNGKSSTEATHVARNYMDFSQGGTWTKAADSAIPYLNAGVVGTRGIFRAFKDDPRVATFKAAQVMGLGFGLAYWNQMMNPEANEEISDRDKSGKFNITTPWTWKDKDGNKRHVYFTIAKDQGQRAFATIGEELANMALGKEANFDRLKMSATDLIPVDLHSFFPPTVSALLGYAYNKDFWRNEDIWRGRKNVSPKEEAYNETPKPWVMFGKATSLSPERSKRAFEKVMPKNIFTQLTGGAINQAFGTLSDDEKIEMSKPFIQKLTEAPIARRMVRSTYPVSGDTSEIINKANKLNIETLNKKGDPIPPKILKTRIRIAERELQNKRIRNDRSFDFLSKAAVVGNADSHIQFSNAMRDLQQRDPIEYKRIFRRIRNKNKVALKYIKQ